ncbi:MAG: deoxyribose-phosphate aldolase [Acutalibacteraceae bacterium]
MDIEKIVSRVDHTLLAQTATWEEIKKLCEEGINYKTASVCIPPVFVKEAAAFLEERLPVCTVVGFPNGYSTTDSKLFETENALKNGADEIDMVIHVGAVKVEDYDCILNEIKNIKKICGKKILKVIIESCLLSREEKIKMCEIVTAARADYIKTSTGFSTGGATVQDIKLFAEHVGKNVKIKAAGGIRTLEDAQTFIELGCSRLGTSSIVRILKAEEWRGY